MSDGVLRQVTADTWQGALHGYRVQVFQCGSPPAWFYHVMHPKGYTCVCPPCESLRDGARLARAWVDVNRLP